MQDAVLGCATAALTALFVWVMVQTFKQPAPPPWRPRIVREAMQLARFKRLAQFRARAFVPQRIVRALRRRADYEFCPLPLILIGYFEE